MRNYKKEYKNYHSRPEQKIRRAARNAARKLFADADPDKDVHHKDNNPLNNDKKNLSLVTQHYNRREPRLRKEDAASRAKEIAAMRVKHAAEVEKEREDRNKERENRNKEREAAAKERDTQEANAVSMSNPDAKVMIGLMQKYMNTKNPNLKIALLKKINTIQSKLGLKVTEDMGTVTGPHIAGTGDDSDTVVVKKKKKVYKRQALKNSIKALARVRGR